MTWWLRPDVKPTFSGDEINHPRDWYFGIRGSLTFQQLRRFAQAITHRPRLMTKTQIIALQQRVGTEPDGFWGPQSTRAAQKHLRDMMPSPHPFPAQSQVSGYYGPHGDSNHSPPMRWIDLPFKIRYEGKPVSMLRPHEKCADSLERVFFRLADVYKTDDERKAAGILNYDGLYNPRRMRGGNSWSMHSWAIAIDLNAGRNGLNTHWPTRATMPIEVMECFALEGWTAAGAFWSRDAMHFQATQP